MSHNDERKHRQGSVTVASQSQYPAPMQQQVVRAMHREGPLPEAQELLQYDQVVPGAADRIIALAEREQAVRHEMLRVGATFSFRGQLIAGGLLFAAVSVAGLAVWTGNATAGAWIVGAAVSAATVNALVSRRK